MEMTVETLVKIALTLLVVAVLGIAILYTTGLAGPLQGQIDSLLGTLAPK